MDSAVAPPKSFQEIILRLQNYWAANGCAILQPYDMEQQPMFSHHDDQRMAATAKTQTGFNITTNIRF